MIVLASTAVVVMLVVGGLGYAYFGGDDAGGSDFSGEDRNRTGQAEDGEEPDYYPSYDPWSIGLVDEGTGCISTSVSGQIVWICPGQEGFEGLYAQYVTGLIYGN